MITIALTHVVGVYLPGKDSIEDLLDHLGAIGSAERVLVLNKIKAHHSSWCSHQTPPRGTEVANWALDRSLIQNMDYLATTRLRRDPESLLYLAFT